MPDSDAFVYRLGGKIYIGNADGILASLSPHLGIGGPAVIVLDLANVQMCDSYGLRLLIGLQRKVSERGARLILFRPSPLLVEILETVKLDQVLCIQQTLDGVDGMAAERVDP